jgi:hypothetical protein
MKDVEPSWPQVVSVWWLIVWRGTLGGLLSSVGAGFVVGIVTVAAHAPPHEMAILSLGGGALIGVIWQMIAIRMALQKRYHDFHLAIVRG